MSVIHITYKPGRDPLAPSADELWQEKRAEDVSSAMTKALDAWREAKQEMERALDNVRTQIEDRTTGATRKCLTEAFNEAEDVLMNAILPDICEAIKAEKVLL